jgi:hypothetical protein
MDLPSCGRIHQAFVFSIPVPQIHFSTPLSHTVQKPTSLKMGFLDKAKAKALELQHDLGKSVKDLGIGGGDDHQNASSSSVADYSAPATVKATPASSITPKKPSTGPGHPQRRYGMVVNPQKFVAPLLIWTQLTWESSRQL